MKKLWGLRTRNLKNRQKPNSGASNFSVSLCLFSLIPLVAFSQTEMKESFSIEKQAEDALLQITLEEEIDLNLSQSINNFDEEDSLFSEADVELQNLEASLPWVPERIEREEITNYLDEKVKNSDKKQNQDYPFDVSMELEHVAYEPTLEAVPKRTLKAFNRPKVIESKEVKTKEPQTHPKKNQSSYAKSTKKLPSLEVKQKKLDEMKEKRKIVTNNSVSKKSGNKVILKSEPEIGEE